MEEMFASMLEPALVATAKDIIDTLNTCVAGLLNRCEAIDVFIQEYRGALGTGKPSLLNNVGQNRSKGPIATTNNSHVSAVLQPTTDTPELRSKSPVYLANPVVKANSQMAGYTAKLSHNQDYGSCSTKLNLPPSAAPLVAVLTGVPPLGAETRETTQELMDKSKKWYREYSSGGTDISKNIIMARRVGWVGMSHKNLDGDCIVLNFDKNNLADYLFWDGSDLKNSGIRPLPLGYFYPPQTEKQWHIVGRPKKPYTQERNVSPHQQSSSGVQFAPPLPDRQLDQALPLVNQYSPFTTMEEND